MRRIRGQPVLTDRMKAARSLFDVALLSALVVTDAMAADCQIADAKLEEAILNNPRLRGPSNRQAVRDLRSLRDAALTLRSYGRHEDCGRLPGNIRELSGPSMGTLGDNDEEEAEKQIVASEPKVQRAASKGRRDQKDAKPLGSIQELAPGLRADEIIGSEVRSSDDKIVGEVRNIVFGTRDRQDYAIVAAGGFSRLIRTASWSRCGHSKFLRSAAPYFLPMTMAVVKASPLMPDQDYTWLSDQAWRTRNDALFAPR